jgi:hypothetical protein
MFWRAPAKVRRIMEDVVIVSVSLSLFFSGWNAFRGSVTDAELCENSAKSRVATRDLVLDLEQKRVASLRNFLVRVQAADVVIDAYDDTNKEYLDRLEERLLKVYPEPSC